jgi:hypothetical protein
MEKPDLGRSDHYIPVRLATRQTPGEIIAASITAADGDVLYGAALV